MATRPTVIEVNCETGEQIERPMTDEEMAQREKDHQAWLTDQKMLQEEQAAKEAAKASALAKLAALGLSEEEAKAIAG